MMQYLTVAACTLVIVGTLAGLTCLAYLLGKAQAKVRYRNSGNGQFVSPEKIAYQQTNGQLRARYGRKA